MNALLVAAASWIAVSGGTWIPPDNVGDLRQKLRPFVERAAHAQRQELASWDAYTFQYQGQGEGKHRFVFINAFCTPAPIDASTQLVMVLDGGACFFSVKFDPAKKRFFDLAFNGEA